MSEFFSNFLLVVPLLAVIVMMLPPIRAHILVAGLVGGILAIIIGGLSLGEATTLFTDGVVRLLNIASVILFASTAMVLARAGSISSTLTLVNGLLRGKVQLVAGAMVLVQALAVYGAGHGAANTLVTAPLVFAAVGFNPLAVVGMSLVSGASWATSPASAESAVIAEAMGMSVPDYASFMLPFTAVIWIVGAIVAFIGVSRAVKNGTLQPGVPPKGDEANPEEVESGKPQTLLGDPTAADWKRALPFFVLLAMVIIGPFINRAIGTPIFTNFTIPLIALALAGVLLKITPNKLAIEFVKGSQVILVYLFTVGVFLGFINMMAAIGTFDVLASLPGGLPTQLVGIGALVIAFLIAIPSASYTAAIDAIILPVMIAAGVPVAFFGFVGIAVAQGAMMSPAQVNVSATAHGFSTTIMKVVRNNAPWMPIALVLTIILSLIAVAVY